MVDVNSRRKGLALAEFIFPSGISIGFLLLPAMLVLSLAALRVFTKHELKTIIYGGEQHDTQHANH